MVKAEFDMFFFNVCCGGGMIFSFDKSTCIERGPQKKTPEMITGGGGGGLKKLKEKKKKEIIIAHPLDKL